MNVHPDFFTPVYYNNPTNCLQWLVNQVEGYFHQGGIKAYVIDTTSDGNERVVLSNCRISSLERIAKKVSYFTVVIPAIMLVAKFILRSCHTFVIVDPQEEMKRELPLHCVETLLKSGRDPELTANGSNFTTSTDPGVEFTFTISNKGTYDLAYYHYFANTILAKEVCMAHHLGMLVIPPMRLWSFTLQDNRICTVLAVRQPKILSEKNHSQADLYEIHSHELTTAMLQLTILMANTGLHNIKPETAPLLQEDGQDLFQRRIALLNLEKMNNAEAGILGYVHDNDEPGLFDMLSPEHFADVRNEIQRQGLAITADDLQRAEGAQARERSLAAQLREFYTQHPLTSNASPLEVDINTLGLDLTKEEIYGEVIAKTITLGELTQKVIDYINGRIAKSSEEDPVWKRRQCRLNDGKHFTNYLILRTDNGQFWLEKILEALKAKGHIFNYSRYGHCDYVVNA